MEPGADTSIASPVMEPTVEHDLSNIYRWIRPHLGARERRAVRGACTSLRASHDREEPGISVVSQMKGAAEGALIALDLSHTTDAIAKIVGHGCQPSLLSLRLSPSDRDAEARG